MSSSLELLSSKALFHKGNGFLGTKACLVCVAETMINAIAQTNTPNEV